MRKFILTPLAAIALMVMGGTYTASARVPWCGIYMSQHEYGHVIPRLKLARNWASEGSPAGGPCIGCIVVWRHHVGKITGRDANGNYTVLSGNDGNRVRNRVRSLRGAIAFRYLGGGASYAQMTEPSYHHRHWRHHHHRYLTVKHFHSHRG